jgi:hypothetical protein
MSVETSFGQILAGVSSQPDANVPRGHARRGRAVVDPGAAPLARSDLDGRDDLPAETADDLTVIVGREDGECGIFPLPVRFGLIAIAMADRRAHDPLLQARGDGHHNRQDHYLTGVKPAGKWWNAEAINGRGEVAPQWEEY